PTRPGQRLLAGRDAADLLSQRADLLRRRAAPTSLSALLRWPRPERLLVPGRERGPARRRANALQRGLGRRSHFSPPERRVSDAAGPELRAVLIVDDVEANLKVLQALLEGEPCSVVSASSGQQALRLLLRQEFAVLLLDVQMPEMDGYEVARHVRMHPA